MDLNKMKNSAEDAMDKAKDAMKKDVDQTKQDVSDLENKGYEEKGRLEERLHQATDKE